MAVSRWLRWVGPGAIALGIGSSIASVAAGANGRPWAQPCDRPIQDTIRGEVSRPETISDLRGTPWFRVDPVLDDGGTLQGQRLTVGIDGERSSRSLGLAAESFAAGPFGPIVLAGSDDGVVSRLEAIDVAAGCSWTIAAERAVIRRATIDPVAMTVYETRVDRSSRKDLGVWLRSLEGASPARRVLAPLPDDDRFGRTFSTEFTWDVSGTVLAVQACGATACRTRVLPGDGNPVITIDEPDLGPLVGIDDDRLVSYEACRGLPCLIVATELASGERTVLASDAGLSVVVDTSDGTRLVHESGATDGPRLRVVGLDGRMPSDLGSLPAGLRLHPGAVMSNAATRLPPEWVLLTSDGRITFDSTADQPQLRHVPDGLSVSLEEALR
ncbi:MAG: hypothetical protein H0T59_09630 [Chloroflexi bacterium]|nr:hypothetical protein [Chloroflexota bacterium]